MCVMLYLGCQRALPLRQGDWLSVEPLANEVSVVREHLQREHAYFIGSHSGCSCGFPCVIADQEVEYFDGLFDGGGLDREKDLASVRELMSVLDEALEGKPDCVLLPVWNGSEGEAIKGDVLWSRRAMSVERFLLTEQFRYIIGAC